MKLFNSLYVVAIFMLFVLSGCYTVISHPDIATKDENGYSYHKQVNFYDDCQSCHTDMSDHKYVKKADASPVSTYHEQDSNGYVSSDNEDSYTNDSYYDDYYESTPYYPTQYYGNYGYYYSRPWWYDVTPPDNSKAVEDYRQSNASQARNNDGGRSETSTRGGGMTFTSPTQTTSGGSSTSSGSSSSSSNSTHSSDSGDSRSSSGGSNARNNDGQRSTNSGRR